MFDSKLTLISFLFCAPLLLIVLNTFLPKEKAKTLFRAGTLVYSLIATLTALAAHYQLGAGGDIVWSLGKITFWSNIDHLTSVLIVLTQFLTFLVVFLAPSLLSSLENKEKIFYNSLLTLVLGLNITFISRDLISFYIGWEIALIGAIILILAFGIQDKIKTALTFFIYTFTGSLFLLLGLSFFAANAYEHSGEFITHFSKLKEYPLSFGDSLFSPQGMIFLAMTFAFMIKAPVMPLHAWIKRTYGDTPSIILVVIAGVMGKMGTYAMIRFMPFFPEAMQKASIFMSYLAAIGIIYGAILAIRASTLKELITYSSLSHIAYIVLGIFSLESTAMTGAIMQIFNHGIIIAGLFIIVAHLEKHKIENLKGLQNIIPKLSVLFFIYALASLGLPSTAGFSGEFFIFLGSFANNKASAIVGMTGIILGAVYMLKAYGRYFQGSTEGEMALAVELDKRSFMAAVLVALIIFILGIFPMSFFQKTHTTFNTVSSSLSGELK